MPSRALEWAKKALQAGWIGVDLFFVLSGFLITAILLRSKGKPHALPIFFARRALRILPLYLAALTAIFVVLPAVMNWLKLPIDPQFQTMRQYQAWAWLHSTNFGMYFTPWQTFQSQPVGIAHFWSLSVEEHYYLVWPLVVLFFAPTRKRLEAVCVGTVCFALIVRLFAMSALDRPWPFFYLLTPCRMDTLAIGSYLAVMFEMKGNFNTAQRNWASVIGGISAIPLAIFFVAQHGLWRGTGFMEGPGYTLIGIVWGSLLVIVLSNGSASRLRRTCRSRVLGFLGTYSYGIYVIHYLLIVPLDRLFPLRTTTAVLGGSIPLAAFSIVVLKSSAALMCALVSWHLLERPASSLKRYFEIKPDTRAVNAAPEAAIEAIAAY